MADLTWGDVVLIGSVATVGFTLLSFWFSGVMGRRGWSWQVRSKPRKAGGRPKGKDDDGASDGNARADR